MANEQIEGIVLSVRKHKEKDFIIQFLSKDYGKLGFYLRGSKQPNWSSKKLTFPFTTGIIICDFKESGLLFVKGSQKLNTPTSLFTDISKNAYATYLGQLTTAAIEDRIPEPELYEALVTAIERIDQGDDEEIISNIFEVHLLSWFGVQPEWRGCSICGQSQGAFDYSPRYKGLLCRDHFHMDGNRYHGDAKAVHLLRVFSQIQLKQVASIEVSQPTKKELRRLIDMLYDELVGLRLKSKSFIDQMYQWDGIFQSDANESVDKGKKS